MRAPQNIAAVVSCLAIVLNAGSARAAEENPPEASAEAPEASPAPPAEEPAPTPEADLPAGEKTDEERLFEALEAMENGHPGANAPQAVAPATEPAEATPTEVTPSDAPSEHRHRRGHRHRHGPRRRAATTTPVEAESSVELSTRGPRNLGFDIVPFVGTSSVTRGEDDRRLSLGLFGALAGSVHGLAASSIFNIALADSSGLQAAGVLNVVRGRFAGTMVAGGLNLVGAQSRGVYAAGVANIFSGEAHGTQLAGGLNIAGPTRGVQIAGGLNVAKGFAGLQLGTINLSSDESKGIQLGVINLSERVDAAFGLFNLTWGGRWDVDVWSGDTRFVNFAVRNGAHYTHTILTGGWLPFGDERFFVAGLGYGLHLPLGRRFAFDLDAMARGLFSDSERSAVLRGGIGTVRLVASLRLFSWIDLYAGPAANVLASTSVEPQAFGLGRIYTLHEGSGRGLRDMSVWAWPGFDAGVRIALNDPWAKPPRGSD